MTAGGASPTKRVLAAEEVAAIVGAALDTNVSAADCTELSTGWFAAVWKVETGDGRSVVLKTSPPPQARLLRYERDLLAAEARYYRFVRRGAPGVPVPHVLSAGPSDLLDGAPILVSSLLPGSPLETLRETIPAEAGDEVREALGRAIADVHRLGGRRFGYSGRRPHGRTWPEAFTAIVEALLADADDWSVELPVPRLRLRRALERCDAALADVRAPVPVHFDLWDGNVIVARDEQEGWSLGGLVDGERWLHADPLVDFVSVCLFGRIEDEPDHPFLRGYRARAGIPLELSDSARARLTLYRMQLYLLMLVEMPSRGMVGPAFDDRREQLSGHLVDEVAALGPL